MYIDRCGQDVVWLWLEHNVTLIKTAAGPLWLENHVKYYVRCQAEVQTAAVCLGHKTF